MKVQLAEEIIKNNPTVVGKTKLAKLLLAKYPAHFNTVESARSTIRTAFKKYEDNVKKEVSAPPKVEKVTFTEKNNLASLTGYAFSLEDLLAKAHVDLEEWEVDTYEIKSNFWDVTMKNIERDLVYEGNSRDGFVKEIPGGITKTNKQFYIKVRLKKRIDFTSTQKFRRELIDEIKNFSPNVKSIPRPKENSGNLLEVNMPDLHLGKMSWAEETGFKDYDLKIAVSRYWSAFDFLVGKAVKENVIDQIVFVVGNDLFNSDNNHPYPMTTKGTPQQDDSRWQKVFRIGRRLIIESIVKLEVIAPVEVKVVPGNHDFQKSFYLGDVLEVKFENDENVVIDNSPKTRKYFTWGKCLLGFTHGNSRDEGEQRMVNNMHHEVKGASDYLYKEWHCGDIHHYKEVRQKGTKKNIDKYAEDIDGVVIKYLRTLFFNDEWEAKKGFISQKGAHCFIWNKDNGNIAEYKYNQYED